MSNANAKRYLLMAAITLGVVFLVTWGTAKLLTSLLPDDKPPPKRTAFQTETRGNTTLVMQRGAPPIKIYGTPAVRRSTLPTKRWVPTKPHLPSHDVLMQRVKQNRTYPKDLPRVKPPGSSHYRLSRQSLKDWINKPLAENGSRFEPNFRGGRPVGMRVRNITPGSFYERLGLYKGDVLLRVNGRKVLTPGHALKRYKQVARGSRNLTLEFMRGGKRHIVDFDLIAGKKNH